jgi:hypothetical protein
VILVWFLSRSAYHRYCVLEIKWNFAGSFISCATGIAPAPDSGTVDNRSLLFDYFLATPLLDINDKTEERKFSGNEDVGHNTDPLGRVINAYIHHVLVDSLGDILLADVQGMFLCLPKYLHDSDVLAYGNRCHFRGSELVFI